MKDLIDQIVAWNAARYEQEFNPSLLQQLMEEEMKEFTIAQCLCNEVETVDGLVDIIFVAIGGLWKMGLSEEQIYEAIKAICDSNDSKTIVKTASNVKANIDKGPNYFSPKSRLEEILNERANKK